MHAAEAKRRGVAQHSPCTVREVNSYGDSYLLGPDGKQLHGQGYFRPAQLAVPEEAGWLPLHYAVALGCGEEVVAALLEAHREVSAWQWWEGGVCCSVGEERCGVRAGGLLHCMV